MENSKKKISVVIPCFNEERTIEEIYVRLLNIFERQLQGYDYEIIYVDDYSTDKTRDEIIRVCKKDLCVKAVFNAKNFGFHRNVFQSYQYATGDCVFMMFGDLQDPPEMLPAFITKWEEGYKCIVGQRETSKEGRIKYSLRRLYYKIINMLSDSSQIEMVDGFGLYDRAFVEVLKEIDDTAPFFNYDFAMHGLTSSTKLLMRLATFVSVFVGIICLGYTVYVFIRKLLFWDTYPLGSASIMIGVFFLGSVQLFFIGILGEYILSINERVCRKPRIIVEKKINFEEISEDAEKK